MQPRMDNRVVLPLPDGPTRNTTSPAETDRLTSRKMTARRCPAPKVLPRFSATMVGCDIIVQLVSTEFSVPQHARRIDAANPPVGQPGGYQAHEHDQGHAAGCHGIGEHHRRAG